MKSKAQGLFKSILFAVAVLPAWSSAAHRQTSVRMPAALVRCEQIFPALPSVLADSATPSMQDIFAAFTPMKDFSPRSLSLFIKHKSVLKQIRDGYNYEVKDIAAMVSSARAQGLPLREIAELTSNERRKLGEKYKNLTPLELRVEIYGRNLRRYNDELGPTFEKLLKGLEPSGIVTNQTYLKIIHKSQSPNTQLNDLVEILDRYAP